MITKCVNCKGQFAVTDDDLDFLDKISPVFNQKKYQIPAPTHCPDCRQQRRLTFRNERFLFQRKCDLCKKDIISFFKDDAPYTVYCTDCWWSDKWDPLDYGRDYDFNKPFFEQFENLLNEVPKPGMLLFQNENSDYNSALAYSKNTYMSPGSYYMEDCYYCKKSQYCKDCYNNIFVDHCELTSSSVNCAKCYNVKNLVNCRNCSDCSYMADSQGCKNCFMSVGLANKEYHFKNKSYSKEEYERIIKEQQMKSPQELQKEFKEYLLSKPRKYQTQINCENSSGDYIQNCKNATECYDCFDIQDSKYLTESVNVKDSMDLSNHDKDIELCYELITGGETNILSRFSVCAVAAPYTEYCNYCIYLNKGFGCDGVHSHASNLILNKKYSPEEYEKQKEKIVEHMIETKEYGEFFPIKLSPYPYNETIAQDYYPLTKEQVLNKKYKWRDQNPKQFLPPTAKVPAGIQETPDDIIKELLSCEKCDKNYKIINQELEFCKKTGIPLSPLCPDCRYFDLLSYKNPRKLYARTCAKCKAPIQTTYAPARPETVYCEKCYLETVY